MWEPARLSGRDLPPADVEVDAENHKLRCQEFTNLKIGGDYSLEAAGGVSEIVLGALTDLPDKSTAGEGWQDLEPEINEEWFTAEAWPELTLTYLFTRKAPLMP